MNTVMKVEITQATIKDGGAMLVHIAGYTRFDSFPPSFLFYRTE